MAFQQFQLTRSFNQSRGIFDKYIYKPTNSDLLADIMGSGYFDESRYLNDPDWIGSIVEISATDGYAIAKIEDGGVVVLYDSLSGGGGAAVWGAITGDIDNQADLAEVAKTNDYDDLTNVPSLSPTGTVIFVHKNGSDSSTGLTTVLPLQTIGAALILAIAMVPAVDNQITIEILDTGTYTESPTLPEWVHIDAKYAALDGRLTVEDNTITSFRRLQNTINNSQPVVRKANGLGFAKLAVELLIVAGVSQEGLLVDAGVMHIDVGAITIDAGIGIKAKNGSRVSFIISEVAISNSGLGIGTRTSGGDPNFFSGNVLYAKDDGTGVLLEAKVAGDVINVQAGSLIVDTLYDMGANTTLDIFVTEAVGSVITDPTATINSTLAGVSNFNPTTGIIIERNIEGVSLAVSQEPTGTGIANALNVEFGAAIGTGSDPVQLDVNGLVTFNTEGLYRVKIVFQFGRTGQSGNSEILFRFLIDGVQLGRSVGAKLGNADDLQYIDIDNWFNVPQGTTLVTQIMRDDSGDDSGGLFRTLPTDEGAGTWNDVPCAVIRIERWVSP